MRALSFTVLGLLVVTSTAAAQAIPENAPAARVPTELRRPPHVRMDPFRYVLVPHWGLVFDVGALAGNNALNLRDIGALKVLSDSSSVLASDIMNAIGLVPSGSAALGEGQVEGGLYLGGPFGGHLSFGVSAQGRAYGSYQIDRDAVAMLREGNATQQSFDVGETRGTGLGTAEYGGHLAIRFGPIGSPDGARVTVGAGGRYLVPIVYGDERTTLRDSVPIFVGSDSIAADVTLESRFTTEICGPFGLSTCNTDIAGGSGFAGDIMVRIAWPTSGLYIEAQALNIGSVTIEGVERRALHFAVATTDLAEIADSLDSASFTIQDTVAVDVRLPRVIRLSAGAWANSFLQLDASATIPAGGEFELPLSVDLWSTWRFVPALPLRLGVVLGGSSGIGYTAGFGVESRHFFLDVLGGSFGGLFENATGVAGRFALGVFF
jgi:hypothetical protein